MEQPPIIQTEPAGSPKAAVGRLGLYFSVAAMAMLLMLWLVKPG